MNRWFKYICFIFVPFVSLFVFNMDVNAEDTCSCYYTFTETLENGYTVYYYKAKYGENYAEFSQGKYTNYGVNGSTGELTDTSVFFPVRSDPFNVNSGKIYRASCSVNACQSADLHTNFKGNKQLHSSVIACDNDCNDTDSNCSVCSSEEYNKWEKGGVLKAISEDEWDKVATSLHSPDGDENVANSGDSGVSSTTGIADAVSPYETDFEDVECDIISDDLKSFLNRFFWVISIAGILLLVIMTMIEFIKVLTGSDDSGLIKGFKHTLIRILAVIILLLLPTILTALINLINKYSTYKVGEDGSVTCGIGLNK